MLPSDSKERKRIPLYSGVDVYFPDALVEVAKVSQSGNDKHNPGEPLHWSREKSDDHEDCIRRHTIDALKAHTRKDRIAHMAARAWRDLAALQIAIENDIAESALEAMYQRALDHSQCDDESYGGTT